MYIIFLLLAEQPNPHVSSTYCNEENPFFNFYPFSESIINQSNTFGYITALYILTIYTMKTHHMLAWLQLVYSYLDVIGLHFKYKHHRL